VLVGIRLGVVGEIARIKEMGFDEVAGMTTENAKGFFGLC